MVKIASEDGKIVVSVPERFDIEEVSDCRNELYTAMQNQVASVVFDFAACQFIDSTGLGFLVSVHKRCTERHAHVTLRNLQPSVANVVKMTRLDQVFDIETRNY